MTENIENSAERTSVMIDYKTLMCAAGCAGATPRSGKTDVSMVTIAENAVYATDSYVAVRIGHAGWNHAVSVSAAALKDALKGVKRPVGITVDADGTVVTVVSEKRTVMVQTVPGAVAPSATDRLIEKDYDRDDTVAVTPSTVGKMCAAMTALGVIPSVTITGGTTPMMWAATTDENYAVHGLVMPTRVKKW